MSFIAPFAAWVGQRTQLELEDEQGESFYVDMVLFDLAQFDEEDKAGFDAWFEGWDFQKEAGRFVPFAVLTDFEQLQDELEDTEMAGVEEGMDLIRVALMAQNDGILLYETATGQVWPAAEGKRSAQPLGPFSALPLEPFDVD